MADGGFLIKFDGKVVQRCYKVSFDYDDGSYTTNFDRPQPLPDNVKLITVGIETSSR